MLPFPDYVFSKVSTEASRVTYGASASDDDTQVELGEQIEFTISVTNRAVIDLFNINIKDALVVPAGATASDIGTYVAGSTWLTIIRADGTVVVDQQIADKVLGGLASTAEDTPYTLWLAQVQRALPSLHPLPDGMPPAPDGGRALTAADLPGPLRAGWAEWWPQHALWLPLTAPDGQSLGGVFYVRDEPFQDAERALLAVLHGHYAFCLQALQARRRRLLPRLADDPRRRRWLRGLVLAAALATLIPVRLSVIAPAEIVALEAQAVAAPTDGVIKAFHVQPNQPVKAGQKLFSLDDTTLRNRREVAVQALEAARADALAASQKAFDDAQAKGGVATLQGRVREKEAEVAYLDELLGRIEVRAAHDGVFVFGDPNDWIGKPVVTGERIAQLARPDDLGVLVWVPVGDAIALERGAPMRVYLQVAPLDALSAQLVETSYQATLSPDEVASYRVRGRLLPGEQAHIGLRGVAKVYGDWRPFLYWVLRRPLGALRQWVGL
ncbi:MAG: HlyD family efflux transporter periplasmic adaptor subunit [Burkholderiales bacterium]|nr:HlyD family efflux transporter periplasmic adaptor subunit [Burkholderiales bacterium]